MTQASTVIAIVSGSWCIVVRRISQRCARTPKAFYFCFLEARCSSVVRAFAHGAMGRRIDPSWGGHIEPFLVPASAPLLV